MRRDEIHFDGLQILTQLIPGDVAAVRGREEQGGVKPAGKFAQLLQGVDACEAIVLDVSFIAEVKIPVAPRLQSSHDGLDGAPVGIRSLQARRAGRAVAARKSDVHDKAALVAFFEEPL